MMKATCRALFLPLCSITLAVQAQTMDPDFNGGVVTYAPGAQTRIHAVASGDDDGCYWAGQVAGDQFDIMVGRTLNNGTLDAAFGGSGIMTLAVQPGGFEFGYDLVIRPDGRLVVGSTGLGQTLIISSVLADGTADPSFGVDGHTIYDLTTDSNSDQIEGLALTPEGSIIATATENGLSLGRQIIVVKFTPDGAVDGTFGTNGAVHIDLLPGGAQDKPHALRVNDDGTILIAGESYTSGSPVVSDMTVVKLLPNGAFDPSFGTEGKRLIDVGDMGAGQQLNGNDDQLFGMCVLPNGHILLCGSVRSDQTARVAALVMLDQTGELVTSFGNGGVRFIDPGTTPLTVNSKAVDAAPLSNGDLLVLLETGNSEIGIALLVRLDANGAMVETFGTNGVFSLPAFNFLPQDLELAGQERCYVAARGSGGSAPSAIASVLLDGTTSILDVPLTAPFSLHPNPCTDRVTITRTAGAGAQHAELFDMHGRSVAQWRMTADQSQVLDLGQVPAGAYVLQVVQADQVYNQRLIVQ